MLIVYGGLIGLTVYQFIKAPTGFIPAQDQGYLINIIQLPPGASLARTDEMARKVTKIVLDTPGHRPRRAHRRSRRRDLHHRAKCRGGVHAARSIQGARRERPERASPCILALNTKFAAIQDAFIVSVSPPPVRGIGTTGGFKMQVQDVGGGEPAELEAVATDVVAAAAQEPGLANVFTTFNTRTPKVYADIDRVRAEMLGVNANDVFQTLEVYLGSQYVNDFNFLGRTYRVTAQADGDFRQELHAIGQLKTRNANGEMVPLSSVASFRDITGPYRIERFNLFPSAAIQGGTKPGVLDGLRARDHGADRARRCCLRATPIRGPRSPSRRSSRATRRSISSSLPSCSCSCCLPPNTKAGRCRSPSSSSCRCALFAAVSGLLARGMDVNILAQIGFRRADRTCGQERDSDRRVRQAERGAWRGPLPGRDRSRARALAPDPDDLLRLYPRRAASRDRDRRRRGDAPVARHRRVLRHDRRHACSA